MLRRNRFNHLKRWLELIREGPSKVRRLIERGQELATSSNMRRREDGALMLEQAREKQRDIKRARESIERYLAIPKDADRPCRCRHANLTLPPQLAEQLIDVE